MERLTSSGLISFKNFFLYFKARLYLHIPLSSTKSQHEVLTGLALKLYYYVKLLSTIWHYWYVLWAAPIIY